MLEGFSIGEKMKQMYMYTIHVHVSAGQKVKVHVHTLLCKVSFCGFVVDEYYTLIPKLFRLARPSRESSIHVHACTCTL